VAYVVTEACINCKYAECVEVCPQDAFREGVNFLVIDPSACSNCALCAEMCPVDAIFPDYDLPTGQEQFRELNRSLASKWPKARCHGPLPEANMWAQRTQKADKLDKNPYRES
jgi:ferredoxin